MNFLDQFKSSLSAILANKLRSGLTMLGVVIGVGSVITMIGIGEGTKTKSLESIAAMGSNMITVIPDFRRAGISQGSGSNSTLEMVDVKAILATVPTVQYISGGVRSGVQVQYKSKSTQTQALGCEPQMAIIRNALKMLQGEWFTADDNELTERKAVLGWQVYDQLFGGENAVGSIIRIRGQNFEVVGVVNYKGGSGFQNPDDTIFIPLKTAQKRLLGKTNVDQISIQAMNTELMPITQKLIEDTLAARRKTAAGEMQFRVFNQGEQIEQAETQTKLLSLLLAGIASVSLLVGGIGIMNIMLVSVTERTREIGLRKALGAKESGILMQFLLESVVMCLSGGLIGIGLGIVAINLVSKALLVPPIVNVQAVTVSFAFSILIGVFFGLYPAIRASKLQPIEALRRD